MKLFFILLALVSITQAQIVVDFAKGTIITQIPPKDIEKVKK